MKRNIDLWQTAGFGVVSLLGTLLHFLYDFTGGNKIAALFSGVNESTWEHMKLLFFPLFLFAVVELFFAGKEFKNFWCIKLKGTLLGLLLIPVLFYTLTGIFGKTPDLVNISIFFVVAAAVFFYETKALKAKNTPGLRCKWPLALLCLVAIAFFVFTFSPPHIPLFQDPLNGTFGI